MMILDLKGAVYRSVSCRFATMAGVAVDTGTNHGFYLTFRIKRGPAAETRKR